MHTPTINAADLHVKTLEYLVDLWDKGLLPEDMQEYVMEEIPILKLLHNKKEKPLTKVGLPDNLEEANK